MALYEREWIWLLNELGVVRLLQGNLHDAITLLETASRLEIQRLELIGKNQSVALSRIRLNLAEAYIERGSFTRVADLVGYVETCLREEGGSDRHSELVILRAVGLLIKARSSFLQSQIRLAREAVADFEELGGHKLGIYGISSICYRILADIGVTEGSNDEGFHLKSIAAAKSSGRIDLELRAEIGGLVTKREKKAQPVRESLREMQQFERRLIAVGLLGILCSLKIIRAELKMRIGATRSAKDELIGALQLTTRYGMRLKRVKCLSEMASAMIESAEDDEARSEGQQLGNLARTEAEKIGYRVFLDARD